MPSSRRTISRTIDAFDLYERCVTEPARVVRFIEAIHPGTPRILREDFSGTGALARAWAASHADRSALAVDADPKPLRRLAGVARVRPIRARAESCRARADVIAATNFPLGYFHQRSALIAYLRAVRASLRPRGVFLADMYGGADAFTPMTVRRRLRGPRGERIDYTWEQREADALTGMVLDTLSFRVTPRGGARVRTFPDAFVYRWRLWSIPELRDACAEAGLAGFEVYDDLADAIDDRGRLYVRPVEPGELDRNWVVYVVARRTSR